MPFSKEGNMGNRGVRSLLVIVVLLAATWIIVPDVVHSQTQEDFTQAYTLGEIVVGAEREGVDAVGTVREVTAEDIQNKGARTLDEALQLLPGVIIRTGADGVPRVDMRGFRSRHVILLLDGIPLNSTVDGQFDPSLIPTEDIEKIKVSYGDHSVLYGDGGLGGVINIITKRGKKDVLHGMVLGEAGDRSHYLGQFNLTGGSGKTDFFLSGSSYKTDGFRLSDDFKPTDLEDGGTRDNSDKRRTNFFANVNYAATDKILIGAVFNYLKGEFGKPPSVIDDPNDPFADRPKFERIDYQEGYSGQLALSYDVPGPLSLRSWLFYNQLKEEDNTYDNNNYNSMDNKGSGNDLSTSVIKGAALQTKYDLKSFGLITVALNARREEFETEGWIIDSGGGGGGGGGGGSGGSATSFRSDHDLDVYSAALEYEITPIKNLGFVLGYGHYWLDKDEGNDNDGGFLIGTYYDISTSTRIRGSVARKIRFPSLRQLYEEESGNPDLTTEESYNYELGLEQRLPRNSKISLVGFLEDVKNYIEKDEATDTFQNNDKYRFQGIELTAETGAIKNLLLRAGYTYLDTEDKSPGTEKDELQNRPKHKLTFESKYDFNFGFSAYMNVIYVADQVFYSKKTPLLKKSLNDYVLVNIKLDQTLFKGKADLYVGVDNLFDVDYEQSYGFPQAGRFIYGGVKVSL
jgi:vitamin B12 transporter